MNLEELFVNKIRTLDISPSQFKLAKERYEKVAAHLVADGFDCDIYPQGSIALGTVIRPYRNDQEQNFDIDMICQLNLEKSQTSPRKVREEIGDSLSTHAAGMKNPITIDNRCFTLNYADTAGLEFKLDIVPAVPECDSVITSIITQGVDYEKAKMAIAIIEAQPDCHEDKWISSNPAGYRAWFEGINEPFRIMAHEQERKRIFEESQAIYASIQEVPSQLERSVLQRTIQILKRHRDVYYCRAKQPERRPASAVITTLTAQAATQISAHCSLLQCLQHVVGVIVRSEELLAKVPQDLVVTRQTALLLKRSSSKWELRNPANPADNLTDSWDSETAQWFFKWLRAVEHDFLKMSSLSKIQQERQILSALGLSLTQNEQREAQRESAIPRITQPTKPWRTV